MKILKICALVFLVMFTVGTVSAAWVAPTGNPTSGNPPAPVNVGEGDQVKAGGLGVNRLVATDGSILENLYLWGGVFFAGIPGLPSDIFDTETRVLTTTSSLGYAEWKKVSQIEGLGGGNVPVGTQESQTLRWNNAEGEKKWEVTDILVTQSNRVQVNGQFKVDGYSVSDNSIASFDRVEIREDSKGVNSVPVGSILSATTQNGYAEWKTPAELGLTTGVSLPIPNPNNTGYEFLTYNSGWKVSPVLRATETGGFGAGYILSDGNIHAGGNISADGKLTVNSSGSQFLGNLTILDYPPSHEDYGRGGYLIAQKLFLRKDADAGKLLVAKGTTGETEWKSPNQIAGIPKMIILTWEEQSDGTWDHSAVPVFGTVVPVDHGARRVTDEYDNKTTRILCPTGWNAIAGGGKCPNGWSISKSRWTSAVDDYGSGWKVSCTQDYSIGILTGVLNLNFHAHPNKIDVTCVK